MGMNNLKSKNRERDATQKFLMEQLDRGFKPKWLISYHLQHPHEVLRPIKETNKPFGYKDRFGYDDKLLNNLIYYEYLESRRNSYDCVVADTRKIKNYILRKGYGIKRINQTWKYEYPKMIFSHELGKVKLQYHTHLILPKINHKLNSVSTIENFFHYMKTKVKSISRWKSIHIKEIDEPRNALSYLNKETMKDINSIDYENSTFTS